MIHSYNKLLADMVLSNMEDSIDKQPQPIAYSTKSNKMIGGKRVRLHPQVGHTAYSTDPSTLISHDNLLFDSNIYGGYSGAGQGNENEYGGSFWDDIGNGLKNVGKEVILPIGKEVAKDALKSYLTGGDMFDDAKHLLSNGDIVNDVSHMPIKDLIDHAKSGFDALTKKLKGGDIGSDILNGLKQAIPFIAPLMMGLGRKPRTGILHHIHPSYSHMYSLVKHAHSKGGDVGSDILNALKQAIPYVAPLMMGLGRGGSFFGDIGHGLKNIGSEVFNDVIIPTGKEVGKSVLKSYLTKGAGKRGRPKKGGDIGSDILNGLKGILNETPLGLLGLGKRGRPKKGGENGTALYQGGASELYPPTIAKGGKRGVKKGTSKRGDLIKKVMKEKGCNLAQASAYIKQHNLY